MRVTITLQLDIDDASDLAGLRDLAAGAVGASAWIIGAHCAQAEQTFAVHGIDLETGQSFVERVAAVSTEHAGQLVGSASRIVAHVRGEP